MKSLKLSVAIAMVFILLLSTDSVTNNTKLVEASAKKQLTATLDGRQMQAVTDMYIQGNVTMVNLSSFLNALDYQILIGDNQIIARKPNQSLTFSENSNEVLVNGSAMKMPVKMIKKQTNWYIPLRYIAQLDGNKVIWHGEEQRIELITNKPVPVTLAVPTTKFSADEIYTEAHHHLIQDMNEQLNVDITLEQVEQQQYKDRLFLKIASGDMSTVQLFPATALGTPLNQFATTLAPYISNYEQLSQLPKQVMEHASLSYGDVFGVPKLSSAVDGAFPVIPYSLLAKYNFEKPVTMEELYIVLKAIRKEDGVGLTGYVSKDQLGSLSFVEHVFNETASRFVWENGTLVDLTLEANNRAALGWLQTIYKEGLLDPEFAILSPEDSKQKFADGIAAIAPLRFDEAAELEQSLIDTEAESELIPLISLQRDGKAAKVTANSPAYAGVFIIPQWSGERKITTSLQVLDYLYELSKDEKIAKQKREVATSIIGSAQVDMTGYHDSAKQRYKTIEEQRQLLVEENRLDTALAQRLDSKQLAEKLQLDEKINQMKLKVILGALSLEDWDEYVLQLKADPAYRTLISTYQSILEQ